MNGITRIRCFAVLLVHVFGLNSLAVFFHLKILGELGLPLCDNDRLYPFGVIKSHTPKTNNFAFGDFDCKSS